MSRIGFSNIASTIRQGFTRSLPIPHDRLSVRPNFISLPEVVSARQSLRRQNMSGERFSVRAAWRRISNMVTPETKALKDRLNQYAIPLEHDFHTISNKFDELKDLTGTQKKVFKQFKKKLSLVLDKIDENKIIREFSETAVGSILSHDREKLNDALNRINNKYGSLKPLIIHALLDDGVKVKNLRQKLDFRNPGKLKDPNLDKARERLVKYNIIEPQSTLNNLVICPLSRVSSFNASGFISPIPGQAILGHRSSMGSVVDLDTLTPLSPAILGRRSSSGSVVNLDTLNPASPAILGRRNSSDSVADLDTLNPTSPASLGSRNSMGSVVDLDTLNPDNHASPASLGSRSLRNSFASSSDYSESPFVVGAPVSSAPISDAVSSSSSLSNHDRDSFLGVPIEQQAIQPINLRPSELSLLGSDTSKGSSWASSNDPRWASFGSSPRSSVRSSVISVVG